MKTIILSAFLSLAAGCCAHYGLPSAIKGAPELAGATLRQVSPEFDEKLNKAAETNELMFFDQLSRLGFVETADGRQRYLDRLNVIRKGYEIRSAIDLELKRRMDPEHDVLLHYEYQNPTNTRDFREGILFIRNGRVRDRLVLVGQDAWVPPAVEH